MSKADARIPAGYGYYLSQVYSAAEGKALKLERGMGSLTCQQKTGPRCCGLAFEAAADVARSGFLVYKYGEMEARQVAKCVAMGQRRPLCCCGSGRREGAGGALKSPRRRNGMMQPGVEKRPRQVK